MDCSCQHTERCIDIVPIFNALNEEEKDEIINLIQHKHYEKGDLIYLAGTNNTKLHIINSGKIKISRLSESGKEQVIRILGPGEFLGELSLFTDLPVTDNAEALEKTSICTIDGILMREHIRKYPEIGFKIMEELSLRLDFVENMVHNISLHSVEWRLARALLKLADKYGVVELTSKKANFASQIGMSQETLSRKLSLFESNKYIRQIGQRKIIIMNRKALSEIE
ncbi:MAG: Crp/Fnr family transcriptional regulator [Bacilli bacterium]|nr:Crp/Fnr family transcriptional regulator [Bacilli bacterium]